MKQKKAGVIRGTFQYTPDMLAEAQIVHLAAEYRFMGRINLYIGYALIGMALIRNLAVVILRLPVGFDFFLFFPGLILIVFYYSGVRKKLFARKIARDSRFQHPFDLEVTEKKISIRSKTSYSDMEWKEFSKMVFRDKFLFLYHSKNVYNLIPLDAIESEKDLEAFKLLVHRKSDKLAMTEVVSEEVKPDKPKKNPTTRTRSDTKPRKKIVKS